MAAGRPVIAYAAGGALDYVLEGITGTFFREQTVDSLRDTVRRFDETNFDPSTIRAHAEQFDVSVFKARMQAFIEGEVGN